MHRAAHILGNEAGEDATRVQRRFDGLVGAMRCHRASAGPLTAAVDHFRKVARSYRPGLFQCYAIPDLPRTNNGLEQLFGSQRYHERRASGRDALGESVLHRLHCSRRTQPRAERFTDRMNAFDLGRNSFR